LRATSEKIRANRANARASTGPKTAQGRTRSARNALRHALSLPVYSDLVLCEEVEALAREIAGTDANAEMQELAHRVAEAQIDLRRVRDARHQLLSRALSNPYYEVRGNVREKRAFLRHLLRKYPEGPHKLATIVSQEVQRLSALDRYERRALSRRRFAIRAFDLARRLS
jgi:DNA repair ATPase RecN